jgi:cell wall-associated NlpC family hydrolase
MLDAARACVGTPFRLQGRDPALGLDCIGLVVVAARAAGLVVPDAQDYLMTDDPQRLDDALASSPFTPVNGDALQAGDIVRLETAGLPLHLGIVSPETLIHADLRFRRVVEHGFDASWRSRLVSAWRLTTL